jgi:hypothetical protein
VRRWGYDSGCRRQVRGKEGIPFKLATTAVDKPDEAGRRALFQVVGEKTLRELVAEAKANEWTSASI